MSKLQQHSLGINTLSIHAGEQADPSTRATSPNLVMSTTYLADPDANFSVEGMETDSPYFYTRWGNPTVRQLEQKLRALEQAESCIAFASGMAAISALFFHLLRNGDHLVISDVAYAAASEMTHELLPSFGVQVSKVDMSDLEAVAAAITTHTKLVYIETPCNPILRLTDISAVAKIAHAAGALVAVDSTFATPIATHPLTLGADFVIHSLTKYLCGHGDAIGGSLLGPAAILDKLRQQVAIRTGGILSPFNAWLILRGIATFPLRMRAHQENALHVAKFLEQHAKVTRVLYPGLPSHPQHELAQRQMQNFSGMLTFQVKDGLATARRLADHLQIFHYAVSLGHHRSLIFYMPTESLQASSFRLPPKQLQSFKHYAGDGIFRTSVGLEDADDLCRDLDQALSA